MQSQLIKLQELLLIGAAFSLALPPVFVDACMGLFTITWLISGSFQQKIDAIKNNPAALVAAAFFGFYIIGVLYSSASFKESLYWLGKEHHLLFIPLIVGLSPSERCRKLAIDAFIVIMLFTLFTSFGKWLGIVPIRERDLGSTQAYTVFKFSIAHSLFMSYAMYLMLLKAKISQNNARWIWLGLAVLAGLNVAFLSNGRTGQVTMIALLLLSAYESWGVKSIKYVAATLILLFVAFLTLPNPPHSKLTNIPNELATHKADQPTSSGERMEMVKNTLILIKNHPFFGGGTGSLRPEYDALVANKEVSIKKMNNPHNQYVLVAQHLGIAGLIMLLLLFSSQWKISNQLADKFNANALKGLVLSVAIGSLFNCLLLAGEGKFYYVLAGLLISGWTVKNNNV
jgi:O-antigen ligase